MNSNLSSILNDCIDIWELLCKKHSELFDITCDEYLTLLSSDMDLLEETVALKEKKLTEISHVDNRRLNLISEFNDMNFLDFQLEKASQLIDFFKANKVEGFQYLEKLNLLLIDIIEKIQAQNKKNQVFLNKALISLNDLKSSFKGGKKLTTYGPQGRAITKNY